jgi:hypothetical protein
MKPGGFVLEPSLGFFGSIGTALKTSYEKDSPILTGMGNLMKNFLTKALLVDTLRFSLCLGYRW